jgi:hypothetical protein
MDRRDDLPERQPLPSEDEGDLIAEPGEGETDDPMIATEEGVPYVPPTERVLSGGRSGGTSADAAGSGADDEEALELEMPDSGQEAGHAPRDEALQVAALEALRRSDLTAGDRVQVDAGGGTVWVRGSVESIDVSDQILEVLGDIPGVEEVIDELEIAGI